MMLHCRYWMPRDTRVSHQGWGAQTTTVIKTNHCFYFRAMFCLSLARSWGASRGASWGSNLSSANIFKNSSTICSVSVGHTPFSTILLLLHLSSRHTSSVPPCQEVIRLWGRVVMATTTRSQFARTLLHCQSLVSFLIRFSLSVWPSVRKQKMLQH